MAKSKKPLYKSKLTWSLIGIALLFTYLFSLASNSVEQQVVASFQGKEITVYKNPFCGCCEGHIEAYRNAGFKVKVIEQENINVIKNEYDIPMHTRSCHTAVMDNYVIEGHVPMSAVEKLIKEQPAVDGITLPGMPSGTPGMPGPKMGDYEIMSLHNGETEEFMII